MRLEVDAGAGRLTVRDAEVFTSLDVALGEAEAWEVLDSALAVAGAGHRQAEWVQISISWLRVNADTGRRGWVGDFEAMIAFAVSRGWVDETMDTVRAHVVRVGESGT